MSCGFYADLFTFISQIWNFLDEITSKIHLFPCLITNKKKSHFLCTFKFGLEKDEMCSNSKMFYVKKIDIMQCISWFQIQYWSNCKEIWNKRDDMPQTMARIFWIKSMTLKTTHLRQAQSKEQKKNAKAITIFQLRSSQHIHLSFRRSWHKVFSYKLK